MRYRVFGIPEPLTGNTIAYVPGVWKLYLVPKGTKLPPTIESDERPTVQGPATVPPGKFLAVQFTVNQLCTLGCLYCYADARSISSEIGPFNILQKGPSQIAWPIVKAAIDRILKDCIECGQPKIEIMLAGGEPTLSMDIVERIVQYARNQSALHGRTANIGMVSNGAFSNRVRRWICANLDYLTISIDGDRETHNRQRPSITGIDLYDRILRNARIVHESGRVMLGVRATVTSLNVEKLPEIVRYLHGLFPGRRIGFEPVQDCGRCSSCPTNAGVDLVPNERKLIESILQTVTVAKAEGIRLKSSLLSFKSPDSNMSFCGVDGQNFSVDPEGYVSACTRVTSRHDPFARIFHFGKYDEASGEFRIDPNAYERVMGMHLRSYPACHDCFAQYNCKADCAHIRAGAARMDPQGPGPRCGFVRALTLGLLQQQLGIRY